MENQFAESHLIDYSGYVYIICHTEEEKMKKRISMLLLAGVLTLSQTGPVLAADVLARPAGERSKIAGEGYTANLGTVTTSTNYGAKFSIYAPDDSGYTRLSGCRVLEGDETWREGEDYMISSDGESGSYSPLEVTVIPLKKNPGSGFRTLTVEFDTDGDGIYDVTGTIIQLGDDSSQSGSAITGVEEVAKEVRSGKLVVTYKLTGTDLKEDQTEIKVKQGMYEAAEWLYDIEVSGAGTEQTVTITFTPDVIEATYTVTFSIAGTSENAGTMTVTVPKEGELEAPEGQTLTEVTPSKTEITNTDRTVEFTLKGTGLTESTGVKVLNQYSSEMQMENKKVEGTGNEQKITLTFPENEFDATYTVSFYANGDTDDIFTPDNKVDVTIRHKATAGEPEEAPEITSVEPARQTVTNADRRVSFTLTGTDLTEETYVTATTSDWQTVDRESLDTQIAGQGSRQTVTITLPENGGEEDEQYQISFSPEETATWDRIKTAIVIVQNDTAAPEDAEVTRITATPDNVGNSGGTVNLQVTGSGLTADNWGVKVTAWLDGMYEYPLLQAVVAEITADGATLEIPENIMKNRVEYRITAGVKDGGNISDQASAVVWQAPKADTVSVDPRGVDLTDDHTIVVLFGGEISIAESDDAALREQIYIADFGTGADKRTLTEEDTVTANGNQLVIKTKDPITLKEGISALYIREGALKNQDGQFLEDISWLIASQPQVTKIVLGEDTLDSTGGTVTAHLKGRHLEDLEEGAVAGSILSAGQAKDTGIPVTVSYGAEPALTFTLPENTTARTQSYLLKVTVNGNTVQEGISGNPAERAVISVLPAGAGEQDITLGSMTINSYGNNPDPDDLQYTETSLNQESKKTQIHLYGTNLDAEKTKVKIVDESGVEWPVYNEPRFDSVTYFIMVANDGTGITGDGNHQILEVICPRNIGQNRLYNIYVSVDGENFIEDQHVSVRVLNDDQKEVLQPVPRTVTVQYVDKDGNEIAPSTSITGYSWFFMADLGIEAVQIEGYKAVTVPEFGEMQETIGDQDRTLQIVYEKENGQTTDPGTDPVTPPGEDPDKKPAGDPESGTQGSGQPAGQPGGAGAGVNGQQATVNRAARTGDKSHAGAAAAGMALAFVSAAVVVKRRNFSK